MIQPVRPDDCSQVPAPTQLRPAVQRVFDCVVQGVPEKVIAARLDLSVHTVHNHVRTIYRHYNVRSKPDLIVKVLAASSGTSSPVVSSPQAD